MFRFQLTFIEKQASLTLETQSTTSLARFALCWHFSCKDLGVLASQSIGMIVG